MHDLQKLCDFLAGYDSALADQLQPLVDELAGSYTETRYPGFDLDKPDWPALNRQMNQIKNYVQSLEQALPGQ